MASSTTRTRKTAGTTKTPAKRTSTVKSSPRKKAPVVNDEVKHEAVMTDNKSSHSQAMSIRAMRVKRLYVVIAVVVIALLALLYYFRGLFVVALVNGQPISHIALIQQLEQQDGQQVLNSLITETLIDQQAKKEGVTVSSQEIDANEKQISDNLSKQGQSLSQVLAMQGMTEQSLRDQIRIQKLIEKMLGKQITVTDIEVNDYIAKNKDTLPQNESEAQLKTTVKSQLQQQKLNDKFQTWLANLKKNANIQYFVNF